MNHYLENLKIKKTILTLINRGRVCTKHLVKRITKDFPSITTEPKKVRKNIEYLKECGYLYVDEKGCCHSAIHYSKINKIPNYQKELKKVKDSIIKCLSIAHYSVFQITAYVSIHCMPVPKYLVMECIDILKICNKVKYKDGRYTINRN